MFSRTTLLALIIFCTSFALKAEKYTSEKDSLQSYFIENNITDKHGRAVIIGFHPEEYDRKQLSRWRDSLLYLAKRYDATLLVPSGGSDASLSSIGDFKFLNRIVDSLMLFDKIDGTRVLAVGERKGADEAILYALSDSSRATGALLYNPLQSGVTHIYKQLNNALGKRFLLIHHYKNFPETRHKPIYNRLKKNQADLRVNLVQARMENFHISNPKQVFIEDLNWFFKPNNWAAGNKGNNYFSYDIPFKEFKSNGKLGIYIVSSRSGVIQINILDAAGASVYQHVYAFPKGKKHLVLPIAEIGYGNFTVEIRSPLGTKSESIIVKP